MRHKPSKDQTAIFTNEKFTAATENVKLVSFNAIDRVQGCVALATQILDALPAVLKRWPVYDENQLSDENSGKACLIAEIRRLQHLCQGIIAVTKEIDTAIVGDVTKELNHDARLRLCR